ncbi:MAG: 2,3-bisphosphoglycerate-independent phosphoglycerate mutase [Planctomycetota bacterium]
MTRQADSSGCPVLLAILDGFGEAPAGECNAVSRAEPDFYRRMRDEGRLGFLEASGLPVGLPTGQMGNSEVGHLTIGAGRTVFQEITRIDRAIETGEFARNQALREALDAVGARGGRVHLLGLVSDGGVHSSDRHLDAILAILGEAGLGPRTRLHAFLDGRDTPPRSAVRHVERFDEAVARIGGRIATVTGRYWAMDRDKRWDRVHRAWDAIVLARGERATDAMAAVLQSHEQGVTDEFVVPTVVDGAEGIADGDLVFFFNFRADRARELSEAFLFDAFDGFERGFRPDVAFLTMTQYRADFPCPVVFPPVVLANLFPELVARAGMRQLRIAETEKYAHVTFFFGGGREQPYGGEDRILVPSPKVATYDLQPEMSAPEVTDRLLRAIDQEDYRLIVLNFANPDMVGHTGKLDAAVAAVRTVDACLGRIVPPFVAAGGLVCLTADHGNCEQMWDAEHKEPHTAHTTNPVPLILYGDPAREVRGIRDGGTLADIAPTLLPFLGLDKPAEMDGHSLLR